MGVELVAPESVSFFNTLSFVTIGGLVAIFIASYGGSLSFKGINIKRDWKSLTGTALFMLLIAALPLTLVGAMNISFDDEAKDARDSTKQLLEEHYEVEFASGNPFNYDARTEEDTFFSVDFIPEDGNVYSGQINIVNGHATLVVPETMDDARYVEYKTGLATSPENSIVSTKVNVAQEYDDLIALGIFIAIIAGLVVGWKFNKDWSSELWATEIPSKPISFLRGALASVFSIAVIGGMVVVFPYLFAQQNRMSETASDGLRALEESYGVEGIRAEDSFFNGYSSLNSRNGLNPVIFTDEGKVQEGFIRSQDGEVSLFVRENSSDVELVEYSNSLLR